MGPKKQQRLTKREQDEILEQLYAKLEIEPDKTVVLGEFIGDSEDVDFNCAESDLSKDEENEVTEDNSGADDSPLVADVTNSTHEEPTEEVIPPNDTIQFHQVNRNSTV